MNQIFKKTSFLIKKGKIAVIPTDTIYGIIASAGNKKSVARLYRIRRRNPKKPCIILCSAVADLKSFGINLDLKTKKLLSKIWPNPVSVILPCPKKSFYYLHRGTKTLAFRIPKNKKLLEFIKKTGPILAPSANFEGEASAGNINEAKNYFGDLIGVYVKGKVSGKPSTLIKVVNGKIEILRQGVWRIPRHLDSNSSSKFQTPISKKY